MKFPSDEEFRKAFVAHTPGKISVAAYGLRRIENRLIESLAVYAAKTIKDPIDVNLEHVIPQKPVSAWIVRAGAGYAEAIPSLGKPNAARGARKQVNPER